MKRRIRLSLLLASAALVIGFAGTAAARPGQPATKRTARSGVLAKHDTNRDGILSPDEQRAARRARFVRLDQNRDGRITRAEMAANKKAHAKKVNARKPRGKSAGTAKAGPRKNKTARRRVDRFTRLDANRNGVVTWAEFSARTTRGHAKARPVPARNPIVRDHR